MDGETTDSLSETHEEGSEGQNEEQDESTKKSNLQGSSKELEEKVKEAQEFLSEYWEAQGYEFGFSLKQIKKQRRI